MGYNDGNLLCFVKFTDAANTKINPSYTHLMHHDQLIFPAIVSYVANTIITMLGGVETSTDAFDILRTMYANRSCSHIF